jgi:hypothetical protein
MLRVLNKGTLIMQKWEYTYLYQDIIKSTGLLGSFVSPSEIWEKKDKDGNTASMNIEKSGKEGWELVSVTPIIADYGQGSRTKCLFFTFKRPVE